MGIKDMNKYKRNGLLSVRATLDRHLKSPAYNKKNSICEVFLYSTE